MSTLFVSDVHLSAQRPAQVRAFLELIACLASRADALYLLGDTFDAWIGDDDERPPHAEVAGALSALHRAGTAVHLMHGNHDFLLAQRYAASCDASLLPDPVVVDMYGQPVLLSHGDIYCTDDTQYQAFRRWARDPVNQQEFLDMSLQDRAKRAAELQKQSRADTRRKAADIMDVNQQAITDALREHAVSTLVHGHTHRPATHELQVDGAACMRHVLGDWYEPDNARVLLWPSQGEPTLIRPEQVESTLQS